MNVDQEQPTQLDPKATALAKAIALQENGGKLPTLESYLNTGKTGERGLYQYTKPTWQHYAGEVLGDPNADPTPENQNRVAYTKVKKWLDDGYKPEQIASMWNAGEGAPDAYSKGLRGTTSTGVKYDVASYAKNVTNYYHQQLQGENQKEEPHSFLGKVMDFVFPIIRDVKEDIEGTSKKSALQQLGDLGLSALWFVPGIGQGIGAGIKATGLLGKVGSQIAGHALGGAIGGYGADVATKLAEGKTNIGEIATPGAGTVTGGVLGGVVGKLSSKYSQVGVLSDIAKSNNSILGQTKRGAQELAESFSKGKNAGELLAKKGVNLASKVNPETVAYETADVASSFRKDAGTLNGVLSEGLQKVAGEAKISELEKAIAGKLDDVFPDKVTAAEAKQVLKGEFDAIRSQYGKTLTASDLNDLKHRAWGLSRFDLNATNQSRKVYRLIGNKFRLTIEDIAKKSGLEGVQEMNEYVGSHLDVADMLDRLNGAKAKGGRLGDLMQRHTLGAVGGIGGFFGGGPVGLLAGALTGEYVGGKLASVFRKIGASPIKTAILKRMIQEDPEIVQKFLSYARETPQGLEAVTAQLKGMGINIFEPSAKIKGITKASPVSVPSQPREGILPRLLKVAGTRLSSPAQPAVQTQ